MNRLPEFLICAALLSSPAAALAGDAQPTMAEIEDEVMCTVCGVPLSLAREAPAAKRERVMIGRLIDEGKTRQQVLDALVSEYGEQVLATPRSSGFDIWAWLVPILLIAGGAGIGFGSVRLWLRRGSADIAKPTDPPNGEDAARVDAALRAQD